MGGLGRDSLGELHQWLGLADPSDGLIDRVDLRGTEETSEIFDSRLDAVVPCEAGDVDAEGIQENVGHSVVEGTITILLAGHRLGDEEDVLAPTLSIHDSVSKGRIERSSHGVADAVDRPWPSTDIKATVVSGVLIHGDDDSVVLCMVLLDVSGEIVHRWDRAINSEGASDEVILGIDD